MTTQNTILNTSAELQNIARMLSTDFVFHLMWLRTYDFSLLLTSLWLHVNTLRSALCFSTYQSIGG